MRLVVDTNILFTFFWKDSTTAELITREDISLISPEFALEEINRYSGEIMKKAGISKKEFKILKEDLALAVVFIPVEEYASFLKEGLKISPDKSDAAFFALTLKFNFPMWSNDIELKKQNKVDVINTKELIELLGISQNR